VLGKRIWTEQYTNATSYATRILANGTDPMGNNQAYNFALQSAKLTPAVLHPGDELRTKCIYDSTPVRGAAYGNPAAAAGQPIQGCETTQCEMCISEFRLLLLRSPHALPSCSSCEQCPPPPPFPSSLHHADFLLYYPMLPPSVFPACVSLAGLGPKGSPNAPTTVCDDSLVSSPVTCASMA